MGRVKEAMMELNQKDREEHGPIGRLDTTGFRPQRLDPDEEWKRRGHYPDGEKYDYRDQEGTNAEEFTYDDLKEAIEFDPEAAEKAKKEITEKIRTQN